MIKLYLDQLGYALARSELDPVVHYDTVYTVLLNRSWEEIIVHSQVEAYKYCFLTFVWANFFDQQLRVELI